MWLENKYRKNDHIEKHWNNLEVMSFAHFYHVGSKESLRNEMQEGLVVKPNYISRSFENNLSDMVEKSKTESLFV